MDDSKALTDRVAEFTERVTALTNELIQVKSEIYINNARLVALEEVKVVNDASIRL